MNKKYIVELPIEQRKRLEELLDTGKAAKHKGLPGFFYV